MDEVTALSSQCACQQLRPCCGLYTATTGAVTYPIWSLSPILLLPHLSPATVNMSACTHTCTHTVCQMV